jgi:hypothetical protein
MKRDEWLDLARKVDWELSSVREDEAFPKIVSGRPSRAAPRGRTARTSSTIQGRRYIFCSEPCRGIFAQALERDARNRDVVRRVLDGASDAARVYATSVLQGGA